MKRPLPIRSCMRQIFLIIAIWSTAISIQAQDLVGDSVSFADRAELIQVEESLLDSIRTVGQALESIQIEFEAYRSRTHTADSLLQEQLNHANKDASALQQEVHKLKGELSSLQRAARHLAQATRQLDTTTQDVRSEFRDSTSLLAGRFAALRQDLGSAKSELEQQVGVIRDNGGRRWTYTWAGLLGLLVVGGAGFLALRRGGSTAKDSDPAASLDELRAGMDKLDRDLREGMLKVDQDFIGKLEALMSQAPASAPSAADPDHSLALKVADEVTRIEQNLARMDASVKGYKQLVAGVGRMKENLQANGYELLELLNKPFHEGMKLTASFVPDDSLEDDERIIVRMYKPTVLFNGTMIQAGEVQVAQG